MSRRARIRVRAPGDTWSAQFREEIRRDRRFEGGPLPREAAVLILVVAFVAARFLT